MTVKKAVIAASILLALMLPASGTIRVFAVGKTSQTTSQCSIPFFFFFPPWYEYLTLEPDNLGQCSVKNFSLSDIWKVVLAIVDMLLRLAGFVAVISIIIAGAQYIFSGGNPEKAAAARWRLYNSLIGLAIVAVATAVVTFIGKQLT